MNTFLLKISSPEGDIFEEKAVMLSVRSTEGELAIMAGHIPFVTSIVACKCKIVLEDGTEKRAATDGGLLTVARDKTLFLSGSFTWE